MTEDEVFAKLLPLVREVTGAREDEITLESFADALTTHDHPDPELLIRTSGEQRLSNFLLWQASYSEIWVTDVFWPDFEPRHLDEGLEAFAARSRKFGAVDPVTDAPPAKASPPRRART